MLNPYVALPLLMATEKFRRQLRHESEQWWAEGLIDADLHARLADRYQFSALEQDASNRFVVILMGLGAILVGLGAITFVAANWQAWSRSLKIVLLLSLFVSVNATGFYLWRRVDHRRAHTLGQGLLLLGALILGANLSLLSQMFHQSGNFYHLLLVWGIGVLAMAYSLRLTSLSVLALILLAWGYSLGWIAEAVAPTASIWAVLVQHMPLFSSLLLIPLAHWCRSRIVFALAASLVAASLVFNLRPLAGWWAGQLAAPGWLITIAFILPPALLWSYDRRFWTWSWSRFRRSPPNSLVPAADSFQPIAHSLTIWFLSLLFYSLSFYWLWNRSPASQRLLQCSWSGLDRCRPAQHSRWVRLVIAPATAAAIDPAIAQISPYRYGRQLAVADGRGAAVAYRNRRQPSPDHPGLQRAVLWVSHCPNSRRASVGQSSYLLGRYGAADFGHHQPDARVQHRLTRQIDRLCPVWHWRDWCGAMV
jgi:uncharacterized membrane protein